MQALPSNPALQDFLKRVPPHVAATFTPVQLETIATALENRQWRRHPVDIRLSMPLLWKRFYVVLIAGEEKRSPDRLAQERVLTPLFTPTNVLAMGLLAAMGLVATGAIAFLFQANRLSAREMGTTSSGVHEAIIPFKEDRASCETSGRTWVNDQCRDTEHDPNF